MSLGTALKIAQHSLFNVTRQTNVVSRNITDATNENYTRRQGVIESNSLGSRVVVTRTNADALLSSARLDALADSEAQSLLADRLDQLNTTLNGVDGAGSPATALNRLHNSLQTYSANPSNELLANAAIQEARSLVLTLNSGADSLHAVRTSTDRDIEHEVAKLNSLLVQFHAANVDVIDGTRLGREVNDALDQRDAALRDIMKIVPVNTISRADGDVVLVTKGGATLFEGVPRNVTFDSNAIYSVGTQGNPVRIDGVPMVSGNGADTTASGTLSALLQVRDRIVPAIQNQLDEIARGLITSFSEAGASGSGLPDLAGLFTHSGGPAIPTGGVTVAGLAGDIRLNPSYDPAQGGTAVTLRDSGANGAAYLENPAGGASFADRLITLTQRLDESQDFDTSGGLASSTSIVEFASQSIGWLDGQRSDAARASAAKDALGIRLSEKLSNQTGVNIDEEMSVLLQLERSYEASARLIRTVDEMLQTLMAAAR
ncbi:MAG: flagellar hook-associated protein FlgK [Rhizobiaceae bacterium]